MMEEDDQGDINLKIEDKVYRISNSGSGDG
jgi:hypothetical protein